MRALLLAAFFGSGCATGWTVDAAKEDQLAYLSSADQSRTAMPARRTDGTSTWLSVRDVERYGGHADPSTGRLPIRRRGRKGLLVGGGLLGVLGLGFSLGGIVVIGLDQSSPPCPQSSFVCFGPGYVSAIIGAPLLAIGGSALIVGSVLLGSAFTGTPVEIQANLPNIKYVP